MRKSLSILGVALAAVGICGFLVNEVVYSNGSTSVGWARDNAYTAYPEILGPAKYGHLVHVEGEIKTSDVARDPDTGFSQPDALAIRRSVKIYQWDESTRRETYTGIDGQEHDRTKYSYRKKWSARPIPSSPFRENLKHRNVGTLPFPDASFAASDITLSGIAVSQKIKDDILSAFEAVNVTADDAARLDNGWAARVVATNGDFTASASPAIGDIKVSYEIVRAAPRSVIAQYRDGTLAPFVAENGFNAAGDGFYETMPGARTLDEMLDVRASAQSGWAWGFRAASIVMTLLGGAFIFLL
jgi:hypothetical protein